jgi:hypothetical protein
MKPDEARRAAIGDPVMNVPRRWNVKFGKLRHVSRSGRYLDIEWDGGQTSRKLPAGSVQLLPK